MSYLKNGQTILEPTKKTIKKGIPAPESYYLKVYIAYNITIIMSPEYNPKKEETGKLEEKTYTEKQNFEDEIEPLFGTHIREAVKAFKDFYREFRTDIANYKRT